MSELICATCDKELRFRWTDTHGIAVCGNCSTPYKLLHYDEAGHSLDLPPEPALDADGMVVAKRYWVESGGMKTFPGVYDFTGVHRRRGNCTYSGATTAEMAAFDEWYEKNYSAPGTPAAPMKPEAEKWPTSGVSQLDDDEYWAQVRGKMHDL